MNQTQPDTPLLGIACIENIGLYSVALLNSFSGEGEFTKALDYSEKFLLKLGKFLHFLLRRLVLL